MNRHLGPGEPKILLLMTPWVLDVLHDFGMGFPCQDLGISGVDCNKMLGAKVAFTIPLGNPWDRDRGG